MTTAALLHALYLLAVIAAAYLGHCAGKEAVPTGSPVLDKAKELLDLILDVIDPPPVVTPSLAHLLLDKRNKVLEGIYFRPTASPADAAQAPKAQA